MSRRGGIRLLIEMGMWCTVTEYGPAGTVLAEWSLCGSGMPSIEVVEDLARRQRSARRRGGRVALSDVCDDLVDLLDLVGLSQLVRH